MNSLQMSTVMNNFQSENKTTEYSNNFDNDADINIIPNAIPSVNLPNPTEKGLSRPETKSPSEPRKRRIVVASVQETGHDLRKNYLKSMGNHELLRKNEEIILARQI